MISKKETEWYQEFLRFQFEALLAHPVDPNSTEEICTLGLHRDSIAINAIISEHWPEHLEQGY